MKYGYARVSTDGQKRKGTSLEEQERALREAGAEKIVVDHYTGTKVNDRPEFGKLIQELKEGDTLLVCKLDRFARTVIEGSQVVRELVDRGVAIRILNMGLQLDNTPAGKLMVTMFLGFAEFERDMIIERTQSGREARRREAEARGETFMDFRPRKLNDDQTQHAMELLDSGKSYKEVSELLNISKSTLIRRRREQRAAAFSEQEKSNFHVPENISTALFQTDAKVYSYVCDHAGEFEKELTEISALTDKLVNLYSEKIRKERDQKLDELAEKVLKDMQKD